MCTMNKVNLLSIACCPVLVILLVGVSGCAALQDAFKTDKYRFLDPSKVIRSDRSPVNPIYSSLGEADTDEELPPNVTFPTPEDLIYEDSEYVIGPTDILTITIQDLFDPGMEWQTQLKVKSTGYIDLPLLPVGNRVMAEGLTEEQLVDAIKDAYDPDIVRDPIVTVMVVAERRNIFSVSGAVGAPSQYSLPRKDTRLLTALAMAQGVTQESIQYIFIIRQNPLVRHRKAPDRSSFTPVVTPELPKPVKQPNRPQAGDPQQRSRDNSAVALEELGSLFIAPGQPGSTQMPSLPIVPGEPSQPSIPGQGDQTPRKHSVMPHMSDMSNAAKRASSAPANGKKDDDVQWKRIKGEWVPFSATTKPANATIEAKAKTTTQPVVATKTTKVKEPVAPKPIVVDKTVNSKPAKPIVAKRPVVEREVPKPLTRKKLAEPNDTGFNWQRAAKTSGQRVIAIKLSELNKGVEKYNIVIRDNDIIRVPPIVFGEFYMLGEVAHPGTFSLTGRRITIKQALAAAGNLGPLAFPQNSVLVRRIGRDKEQTIPLDLEAIVAGREPDIFLKPYDLIEVGTHWEATFMAVVRNAFRLSYGFGLIYDRNLADPLFTTPKSNRFTRW